MVSYLHHEFYSFGHYIHNSTDIKHLFCHFLRNFNFMFNLIRWMKRYDHTPLCTFNRFRCVCCEGCVGAGDRGTNTIPGIMCWGVNGRWGRNFPGSTISMTSLLIPHFSEWGYCSLPPFTPEHVTLIALEVLTFPSAILTCSTFPHWN